MKERENWEKQWQISPNNKKKKKYRNLKWRQPQIISLKFHSGFIHFMKVRWKGGICFFTPQTDFNLTFSTSLAWAGGSYTVVMCNRSGLAWDMCFHLVHGTVSQARGSSPISAPVMWHLVQVSHPPGGPNLSRLELRNASAGPSPQKCNNTAKRQSA